MKWDWETKAALSHMGVSEKKECPVWGVLTIRIIVFGGVLGVPEFWELATCPRGSGFRVWALPCAALDPKDPRDHLQASSKTLKP